MSESTSMQTHAEITRLITGELEQVIRTFDEELRSDQAFIRDLEQQVRRYRGKLIRPTLLLLTGRAAGDLRDDHIVLAAVVEMVHMATLLHDDVLDEADVRRRNATVNRLYGNEGAVLFGDYLISHAYHLCSRLGSTHASRRIAAATNTVCEGELMQIFNRGNLHLSEPEYIEIIRRKTAALISVCCELGAEAAGADVAVVQSMAAFGENLGVAFQIVDDLLDLTATERETGKTVGRDADMGKMTLPAIRFMAQANENDRAKLAQAMSAGEPSKSDAVRAILGDSGSMEYAMDVARSYAQSATASLAALPPSEARDSLSLAAEFAIRRRT